ncbi:aspartyl-tRNA(Asn)/glutamyl-tRNA(Gln) amidotransferase subunit A [Neorhizobium galegae]|uniref:amidase n=1 Tax=Neorhizobium galegae TaxID=399 RepID=UPI00278A35EC|nr:amidase [Neorhizobium galegae]MDQ0137674.1 aspartyl-tRNA(Asn)/glutamyl-tRNA(Gln) amidotransferase subunit A [Neorhizobium galegae]
MSIDTIHTIAEASKRLQSREISPVELLEFHLERIARLEPRLNSFITVDADGARAAAKIAENEIRSGNYRGPMHGIPFSLKDVIDSKGIRTTGHSKLYLDRVPTEDATVTRKLKDAGAVLVGKNATHEFAMGQPSYDMPFPPARNPWDTERGPGGSSSGSGSAVSAGLVLGALGSDTGGSIRNPCALCGITGLKPTHGLVSRAGTLPLSKSLDAIGPMTWTVEDTAIMLSAIAGYDGLDAQSVNVKPDDYRAGIGQSVKGMKIAALRQFYTQQGPASPEIVASVENAIRIFQELGAEIVDIGLPELWFMESVSAIIAIVETWPIHKATLGATPELYGDSGRNRLAGGAFVNSADYFHALDRQRELQAEVRAAMKGVDALITTSSLVTAPLLKDFMSGVSRYDTWKSPKTTSAYNLLGLPALAVPSGFSSDGLPVSIQLIGHAFAERKLFTLGHAFEQAIDLRGTRPNL